MTVDIIIPVYKPDNRAKELLRRLTRQTVRPGRIILINTEKDLFDSSICEGVENIEVYHVTRKEFDHGATRHLGTTYSDADIVMFLTQDALPKDSHLIENLIRPIELGEAQASYGRQLPESDCGEIERYTRSFNYPDQSRRKTKEDLETLGVKAFFCSDVCSAYLRSAYEEMGGFIRKTIFNEDMIMAGKMIQNDMAVYYCADARVIHSHNYTGIQQLHRNFDLAVSQADHPEIFEGIRSESEGIRLVKNTAVYLLRIGQPQLIAELIWKSGWKYIGYKLGQNYRKLPRKAVLALTMNPSYWN